MCNNIIWQCIKNICLILYTTIADNQPVQHLKSKMLHLLPIGVPCHLFDVWWCQESYFRQTIWKRLYGQCLTSFISVPARGELGLTLLIIAARKFWKMLPSQTRKYKIVLIYLEAARFLSIPYFAWIPYFVWIFPCRGWNPLPVQEFCYWADNSWVNWSVPTDLK